MTQVSWTRQLGLAAILFALGTFVYWNEFKQRPAKEAAEEAAKKLFLLDGNLIESIRLSSGSASIPDLVFSCLDFSSKLCKPGDPSKWQITEPTRARADDSIVNSTISTLSRLSYHQIFSLKDETPEKRAALLKDYGLDPEARKTATKIEVITDKGVTVLVLGSSHPIGGYVFALEEKIPHGQKPSGNVDENQVYLVQETTKNIPNHELAYWRDKKVMTLASHEIESFQVEGSKGLISGTKATQGWTLKTSNRELPGDAEQITLLFDTATSLRTRSFAANQKNDAQGQAALKGAFQVLALTLQKEKGTAPQTPDPIVLRIYRKKTGNEPAHTYATVSNMDPLFEIDPSMIERMDKGTSELRLSKLLSTIEGFNVQNIEFSSKSLGETPLILTQKDKKWIATDHTQEVDSTKIQKLINELTNSKVKEILSGVSIPPGEDNGLTLQISDQTRHHKWVFWRATTSGAATNGSPIYAKDLESASKEAFLMETSLADALPGSRDFFKKAAPKPASSPSPETPKK